MTIHGGPTSNAVTTLALARQFWTSRGFAVADVDYGGSTGYGRAYRNRLQGQWGVLDVGDCVAVARWLGDQGWIDPARVVIRGGSAGGFTVLMALARSTTCTPPAPTTSGWRTWRPLPGRPTSSSRATSTG